MYFYLLAIKTIVIIIIRVRTLFQKQFLRTFPGLFQDCENHINPLTLRSDKYFISTHNFNTLLDIQIRTIKKNKMSTN